MLQRINCILYYEQLQHIHFKETRYNISTSDNNANTKCVFFSFIQSSSDAYCRVKSVRREKDNCRIIYKSSFLCGSWPATLSNMVFFVMTHKGKVLRGPLRQLQRCFHLWANKFIKQIPYSHIEPRKFFLSVKHIYQVIKKRKGYTVHYRWQWGMLKYICAFKCWQAQMSIQIL